MAATLRLLLATSRAGVGAYLRTLPVGGGHELSVEELPFDSPGRDGDDHAVAVVDVDGDHEAALGFIRELRSRRPELPVVALLCCSHGATAATMHDLSDVGVSGMVDLHATPEQTWETVAAAAGGSLVVHVRSARGSGDLRQVLTAGDGRLATDDVELLRLLSEGLTDHEMAERLYLSPHTIKHRIEQLRDKTGARNRIALAAWAGRNGLARAEDAA